jgi:hypothetical protein
VFLPAERRTPATGAALAADHGEAVSPWLRAAVLYRLGRFAESLAVTDGESRLQAQFVRAMCLAASGRRDEAGRVYAAAARRLAGAALREPEAVALQGEAAASLGER